MRRIPAWVIVFLIICGAFLAAAGWHERHHVGYVPFVLGVFWVLFALASGPRIFDAEKRRSL